MSAMPLRTLHTFRLPYLLKKRIQIPTHTFENMIRSASSESVPVTSAPRKRRGRPKLSDKLTGASKNPVGTYQHKTIETPEKSTTLDETSNVFPERPKRTVTSQAGSSAIPKSSTLTRRRKMQDHFLYTEEPLYTYNPPLNSEDIAFCHPHLPHPSMWKSMFAFNRDQLAQNRYFVANRGTVDRIIDCLGLNERESQGIKTTIVDAYSGPGTFTRAFMQHPNVESVIAIDQAPRFLKYLEHLYHDPALSEVQHKLSIVHDSAFNWSSYESLVNDGHLRHLEGRIPKLGSNPPPMDWHATSPIIYFAQLPNTVHGEQLFAQIVHAISSRSWLFKFGRVKMVFVCGDTVSMRSLASPQDLRSRAKLGTVVQSLSTPRLLLTGDDLEPYASHMFPPTPSVGPRVPLTSVLIPNTNISSGLLKRKLSVLEVEPLKDPLIDARDMESFEFLTRNMFVLKTKTVEEGLKHVMPGANNVLRLLSPSHPRMRDRPEDVVLPDTPIVQLTNRQWASLAEAFEKWPFKPTIYMDEGRIRHQLSDSLV